MKVDVIKVNDVADKKRGRLVKSRESSADFLHQPCLSNTSWSLDADHGLCVPVLKTLCNPGQFSLAIQK
jgi:hypothetical protein